MTDEQWAQLTREWGFAVAVVFAVLVFAMFFGEKPTFYLLLLILSGQILVNWRTIAGALGGVDV